MVSVIGFFMGLIVTKTIKTSVNIFYIFTVLITLFFSDLSTADTDAIPAPNVIVILTDDHGYSDLGSQRVVNDLLTPNIDSLAAGGARMTNGYVTAPQCVPTRVGLLSGRYQNRFGVEDNKSELDGFSAQATIGERLQQAGYTTGMVGKWHLGPDKEIESHGFDYFYRKDGARAGWANYNLDGTERPAGAENTNVYHLEANTIAAKAFIYRHREQPFFLFLAYRAPHLPMDAPGKYLKRFPEVMPERRRQALAMLSAVDDGVGEIVASLVEYEILDRTLIFFIGDNGAPLKNQKIGSPCCGPAWNGSLNQPLNGEKGMLAEGGIRVPFIVYWKGHLQPGQKYHEPVSSLDVAATVLSFVPQAQASSLDGINLLPYLATTANDIPFDGDMKAKPERTLYWRWRSQAAVRQGKWKYLRAGTREYLFDLDRDIGEKINLITSEPATANRLRKGLEVWSDELQPPGIKVGRMVDTQENYYDYYMGGVQP